MKKKYEFTDEMLSFLLENQNISRDELANSFNSEFETEYPKDTIRLKLYEYTDRRLAKPHIYTKEQEKFLEENSNLSHKEMTNAFNKKFGTSISQTALISKRQNMGMYKFRQHNYSEDEIKWLKSQPKEMSKTKLYEKFCKEFGFNLSKSSLFNFLLKSGIRADKRHHYTKEENDFLVEHIGKVAYKKLADLFNKEFDTDISVASLRGQCLSYLGVKQGFNPKNHLEVGATVKNKVGYARIKTTKEEGLARNIRWKPLSRLIYEQHYGEIPENSVIVFLDGNKQNLDISNLYCITKSIHAIMANHKWFTESREHTLAAIKWCELYYALKECDTQ